MLQNHKTLILGPMVLTIIILKVCPLPAFIAVPIILIFSTTTLAALFFIYHYYGSLLITQKSILSSLMRLLMIITAFIVVWYTVCQIMMEYPSITGPVLRKYPGVVCGFLRHELVYTPITTLIMLVILCKTYLLVKPMDSLP